MMSLDHGERNRLERRPLVKDGPSLWKSTTEAGAEGRGRLAVVEIKTHILINNIV